MKRLRMRQALAWIVPVVLLGGVFLLYAQADFMVQMANQLWACF